MTLKSFIASKGRVCLYIMCDEDCPIRKECIDEFNNTDRRIDGSVERNIHIVYMLAIKKYKELYGEQALMEILL